MIFSILFRVSNHQIVGKRNKLHLLFKLSYLSSNFALTLGYLNPASNNPAQNYKNNSCTQFAREDVGLWPFYNSYVKKRKLFTTKFSQRF